MTEELELQMLTIGAIVAVVAALIAKSRRGHDEARLIEDASVTRELVLEKLAKFVPEPSAKLKNGYTEKSIEKQLDSFLKERFVSVTCQFKIGGIRGTTIDFSIGSQAVGLELKLLPKLFKSGELHRLQGQLTDYKEAFPEESLIVLAVGEAHHLQERPHIAEIKSKATVHGAEVTVVEIQTAG